MEHLKFKWVMNMSKKTGETRSRAVESRSFITRQR